MAAKKMQKPDKFGNTMEDYDRWGTPRGMTVSTSKPTPEQQRLAARINAQRAAEKTKKTAKKK